VFAPTDSAFEKHRDHILAPDDPDDDPNDLQGWYSLSQPVPYNCLYCFTPCHYTVL